MAIVVLEVAIIDYGVDDETDENFGFMLLFLKKLHTF